MRASKRVYWVLIIFIISFLVDGVLTNHFPTLFLRSGYSLTPRIVVIAVVMLNFMIDNKSMFWFSIIAGFFVDSYYSGILGVYMGLFAIIVRIIRLVRSNILQNPFTLGLAIVCFLSFTEIGVYFVYALHGVAGMNWNEFLVQRLSATLILNIVIYYILYIPFRNFARWVVSTPVVSPHDLSHHRRSSL